MSLNACAVVEVLVRRPLALLPRRGRHASGGLAGARHVKAELAAGAMNDRYFWFL
jgi:hypothetical protein